MPYVITEACIGTKDRSCVEVCPVDCFYDHPDATLNEKTGKPAADGGAPGMLVIHPDECIHCGACEPECPVGAIFADDDVPDNLKSYITLNETVTKNYSDEELKKNHVTSK
jgi:ferredoxin